MEERPTMDGSVSGYYLFSARNSGDGIPDSGEFNKRSSHHRMSESNGSSRNRSGYDPYYRSGSGSEATGLPIWYYIGVVILAATFISVFLVSML